MNPLRIILFPLILLKRAFEYCRSRFLYAYYKASGISIGKDVFISPKAYLDKSKPNLISIGDNCMITRNCMILCHTDAKMGGLQKIWSGEREYAKTTIGKNVFLGVSTVVMPGVTIGDNVIVGALSLVNKDIPSNSIAYGSPAKIVKKLNPKEFTK